MCRRAAIGAVAAVTVGFLAITCTGPASARVTQASAKNGRIAFRRYFDGAHTWGAIFTINPDGTGERQVTHPPKGSADWPPRWSPNASLIVFTRCPKGGRCVIYTVRPDGLQLTLLSQPCKSSVKCEDDSGASFLPDGRHVVFSRFTGNGKGSSIVVTSLRRWNPQVVVAGTQRFAYTDPEFSPDGSHVAFVRGSGDKSGGVCVATSHGGNIHQISPTKLDATDGEGWSPNGKWIIFRSHVDDGGASQIYHVHPNGSGLKQLTHFKKGAIVTSSQFSPDGKWIVFGTNGVGGNTADVFVMHADGTGMRHVTRTKQWESAPAWGRAN